MDPNESKSQEGKVNSKQGRLSISIKTPATPKVKDPKKEEKKLLNDEIDQLTDENLQLKRKILEMKKSAEGKIESMQMELDAKEAENDFLKIKLESFVENFQQIQNFYSELEKTVSSIQLVQLDTPSAEFPEIVEEEEEIGLGVPLSNEVVTDQSLNVLFDGGNVDSNVSSQIEQ